MPGRTVGALRLRGDAITLERCIVGRVRPKTRRPSTVLLAIVASAVLVVQSTAAAGPPSKADPGLQNALAHLNQRAVAYGLANHAPPGDPSGAPVSEGFEVVGHNALGARDSNGDVWVHDDVAYVGTWRGPCTGRGVKIIDVSDPTAPRAIGALAARRGTSAEDMVVRSVETASFTGDLMAVGMQRCGRQGGRSAGYGVELWDVTDPYHPSRLADLAVNHGDGGVHELDLIQRGDNVYVALATPFSEWFDPLPGGDVFIVDATDPRRPSVVSEWGVADDSPPQPGPFYGTGSFGAAFAHSVRFSDDGSQLFVSYWDRGVITLDISDVRTPVETAATVYPPGQDGDAHSMTPYGQYLLANDEDFDPRSPAEVRFNGAVQGYATEHPLVEMALWDHPGNQVAGDVVMAVNEGCDRGDYPSEAAGAIVVVQTPIAFFEDAGARCSMPEQENLAQAAGAAAVVHRFDSPDISPQWWDFSEATIPVLFTDVDTADGMVSAGTAIIRAQQPTWGFLRVYDAATGVQVSQFDDVPNINDLSRAGAGFWSIHNTEVSGSIAYAAWYSNGIVALDLDPIDDIRMVGQFVPPGEPFAEIWGVFVGDDGLIYASDLASGLWIIRPTFDVIRPTFDD